MKWSEIPWALWRAQLGAVLRIEVRKNFLNRRALWVYLLALGPVLLFGAHSALMIARHRPCNFGQDTKIFAGVFQFFYVRLAIFFGCLGIFMNLFRGEVRDRSLHYYFLAPVRRELLVAGKFLAGVIAAGAIFTASVPLQLIALWWHFDSNAVSQYLANGGWQHTGAYLAVALLACAGYGSVFLAAGLMFQNPLIPASTVLLWESINPILPSLLKKFSVIFYLKSMCPVEIPIGPGAPPLMAMLVVNTDPIPAAAAAAGLIGLALLVLVYSGWKTRRMEISYGAE